MARNTVVGFFFLFALALFLFAAITVQGLTWGEKPYFLTVQFSRVSGLSNGDNIRVRGFDVGRVEELGISEDRDHIWVRMRLNSAIKPREDYRFTVMPSSALGGNFVDYVPGESTVEAELGSLRGDGTTDLLTSAGKWFDTNSQSITEIIDNIKVVTERLEQGTGVIGRLVSHQETQEKFDRIVDSVQSIAGKIDTGDNLLGQLINNQEYADRFDRILTHVQEITRKADEGEGPLAVLLNDTETGEQIKTIVSNLEATTSDLRDQKGILGRLVSDPEYGKELEEILSNVESFTNAIANGPGTVHDLLYDDALQAEMRAIFENIAAATEQLGPDGDGTFAELLHGKELAQDIRGTITLLRESIEDTREMAPLNTFINVLFSAF